MNKSVVISGGSQGIGKALVKKFLAEQFTVFTCSRSQAKLDALAAELANDRLHTFAADLSQKNQVLDFANWVLKQTNQIEVLVNNTGVFIPGQIQNEAEDLLEKTIETNLYSAYHLTRALLHVFQGQKSGHIFSICSTASITA
ncbi:MAG: hypothetical protein RL638_562, partial [Bacteroidota bacterium]